MEIDIKKVYGELPNNEWELQDLCIKAQKEVIEALHIMQSTIENFDDAECLELNKKRMIEYFNKFAKDGILSK